MSKCDHSKLHRLLALREEIVAEPPGVGRYPIQQRHTELEREMYKDGWDKEEYYISHCPNCGASELEIPLLDLLRRCLPFVAEGIERASQGEMGEPTRLYESIREVLGNDN